MLATFTHCLSSLNMEKLRLVSHSFHWEWVAWQGVVCGGEIGTSSWRQEEGGMGSGTVGRQDQEWVTTGL